MRARFCQKPWSRQIRGWIAAAGLIGTVGCKMVPTRITETAALPQGFLLKNASGPVALTEATVVIDARGPFDYSIAHVPGAINLTWEDFARPRGKVRGHVTEDLAALIKRLALYGIGPETRVVVVGRGRAGMGEEGRVAWSLAQIGVRDVQVASIDMFKAGMTNAEPAPRANVPEWQPTIRREWVASREEVLAAATAKVVEQGPQVRLIDVRSRKEYFEKWGLGAGYVVPDLRATHIPWEQFYTVEGRPNIKMRNDLLALGWKINDRLIVISHHGVRSGAVAFALMSIGFENVANYTGGIEELMALGKRGPKLRPVGK